MRSRQHLIIFTRPARLGAVKTRLGAAIGHGEAWRFHRHALRALVMDVARDPRWQCWLALPNAGQGTKRDLPITLPVLDQGAGDIGARMARVIHAVPPGPAVLVGTDIPDLRRAHIAAAFRALGRAEIVFGPAADGGFWLVGFRRSGRALDPFTDVRWSSPHALADALARLPKDARVATITTLEDVDDGPSHARWRAQVG